MKIIDNKKDYYDYLSGVYGIDNLIVYDRRGSVPISPDCFLVAGCRVLLQSENSPLRQAYHEKELLGTEEHC